MLTSGFPFQINETKATYNVNCLYIKKYFHLKKLCIILILKINFNKKIIIIIKKLLYLNLKFFNFNSIKNFNIFFQIYNFQ